MSGGLVARLRAPLRQRADFSEILAGSWTALSPQRAVPPHGLPGRPWRHCARGTVRSHRRLERSHTFHRRPRAGGSAGSGNERRRRGSGGKRRLRSRGFIGRRIAPYRRRRGTASRCRSARIQAGDDGRRARGARLGGTGGRLRHASGACCHCRAGRGPGRPGHDRRNHRDVSARRVPNSGLWSKRGSLVALGGIDLPPTYAYACTYQPVHLKLLLTRLRDTYDLPVRPKHLNGFYRRYSGDLAELGKGEILTWSPR